MEQGLYSLTVKAGDTVLPVFVAAFPVTEAPLDRLKRQIEVLLAEAQASCEGTAGQAKVKPLRLRANQQAIPRIPSRTIAEPLREQLREWAVKGVKDGVLENAADDALINPLHIARKEGKADRIVIDFRWTNQGLADDNYPVPDPQDILFRVRGCKHVSVIDLKSGFNNVLLDPLSRPFTGIFVPGVGKLQFCVVPFGLKVAPS